LIKALSTETAPRPSENAWDGPIRWHGRPRYKLKPPLLSGPEQARLQVDLPTTLSVVDGPSYLGIYCPHLGGAAGWLFRSRSIWPTSPPLPAGAGWHSWCL